jgi:hypothetical protein
VFRWRDSDPNWFAWRNRVILVPSVLVARRMNGDRWNRVERVSFRIRDLSVMKTFSDGLETMLRGNHRQQGDFRIDDVAARVRRQQDQGQIYNLIFMLSGVLSLLGGGLVNVNIQMAALKDRVREVGVKMAIGASGGEVFKGFMTEALLLTGLGSLVGLVGGVAFSAAITAFLKIPLFMQPKSFAWALLMAAAFGFVFALYPAWKASRLSPMEALRYEWRALLGRPREPGVRGGHGRPREAVVAQAAVGPHPDAAHVGCLRAGGADIRAGRRPRQGGDGVRGDGLGRHRRHQAQEPETTEGRSDSR